MFRLWAKEWKNNHLLRDMVIEDDSGISRTKKVFAAIDTICYEYNLSKPIWLDKNIEEFKRIARTRFYSDNFIDSISFDYLEVQIIEED